MNDQNAGVQHFVAFYPHDDVLSPLSDYRSRLFYRGVAGALALPLCVFLGESEEPVPVSDLKRIARLLRDSRGASRFVIDRVDTTGPVEAIGSAFGIPLYAAELSPPFVPDREAVAFAPFSRSLMVLAARGNEAFPEGETAPFPLAFRVGYVANLAVRAIPVGAKGFSYEWERGKPVWLPR